jgi:hypothetical protein
VAFRNTNLSNYYPTVSIRAKEDNIRFNFGPSFFFQLSLHVSSEKKLFYKTISKLNVDTLFIHKLVSSYLYFSTYFETLEAFENNCGLKKDDINLLTIPNTMPKLIEKNQINGKSKEISGDLKRTQSFYRNFSICENIIFEEEEGESGESHGSNGKKKKNELNVSPFKNQSNFGGEFEIKTRAKERFCKLNKYS